MPDAPVVKQEITVHLFAPSDGPLSQAAETACREIWSRCRTRLAADEPVSDAWPHQDFKPWQDAGGPAAGIAAVARDAEDTVQIVLRHEHEVACLSLLLAVREGESWLSLDRRLQDVLQTDRSAFLGSAILFLGETPKGEPAPTDSAVGESLRLLLPEAGQREGWWRSGGSVGPLALWELTAAEDGRTERRFVILRGPDDRGDLSAFAWSAGGSAALPAFARYLLHLARLRYQLPVRSQLPDIAELGRRGRSGGTEAATTAELSEAMTDRSTMRHTVTIAAANAWAALSGLLTEPGQVPAFQDDARLASWLEQVLDDDLVYLDAFFQGARRSGSRSGSALAPALSGIRRIAGGVADPAPVVDATVADRADQADRVDSAIEPADPADAVGSVFERPLRILALADEWFPSRGGVSAVNRRLCVAMVERGAEVFCAVPAASAAEIEEATAHGVHLLVAPQVPGMSERQTLMRRPVLPDPVAPDAVIGHTRVTGPAAEAMVADHFPAAVRVHVVHMEPNRIEWYKAGREDDVAERAHNRSEQELLLAAGAHLTVPVGPRLDEWAAARSSSPWSPHRTALSESRVRPSPQPGRQPHPWTADRPEGRPADPGDGADGGRRDQRARHRRPRRRSRAAAKPGAGAVGTARPRRAEGGGGPDAARLADVDRAPASRCHGPPLRPGLRRIGRDLARASLVLLPSRAEGFGLVGLEAIASGTPTLVSARSGLGMLLEQLIGDRAAPFVLPVTDGDDSETVDVWAHSVATVLGDRETAFARAAELRALLVEQCNWAGAADDFLAVVRRAAAQIRED